MALKRVLLLLWFSALVVTSQAQGFYSQFNVTYAPENVYPDDAAGSVKIALTANGHGPTFVTNDTYLFGDYSSQIKLVPGDSAGTVAAFFLSSSGDVHDEIDFEFLGNVSGQPYILHTNLFANGTGGREEDTYLWFDPTADFHTYRVIWNHQLVLWLVDDIPIRVYKNLESVTNDPLSFPSFQPMGIFGCIYDGGQWATEGGLIPVNYTDAPFIVTYQDFVFDGCLGTNTTCTTTNYTANPWEEAPYNTVNQNWINQMNWVREHYLHYDYCTDPTRYPTPPIECSYNEV